MIVCKCHPSLPPTGILVRVNGREVGRSNLPNGAIGHTTRASSARTTTDQGKPVRFWIPIPLLRVGTNVIAAEVHASSAWTRPAAVTFDAEVFTYNTLAAPALVTVTRGPYIQV